MAPASAWDLRAGHSPSCAGRGVCSPPAPSGPTEPESAGAGQNQAAWESRGWQVAIPVSWVSGEGRGSRASTQGLGGISGAGMMAST